METECYILSEMNAVVSIVRENTPFDLTITVNGEGNQGYIFIEPDISIDCDNSDGMSYDIQIVVDHQLYEVGDVDITCDNITDTVEGVLGILKIHPLYKHQFILHDKNNETKKLKGKILESIEKQEEQLHMIINLFSSDGNKYVPSGNLNADIDLLLKLQDKCHDLLTTILEYKPDSEVVKSLEEDFDKLARISHD